MPHGPEHHLEEAEHAQHAAHDEFTKRVAMSMAIVAATLACVTLLSHRAHNATLSNQIKANDNITERANVFNRYQAKKNRQYQAEANAQLLRAHADTLAALPGGGGSAAAKKARDDAAHWEKNLKKWTDDAKVLEAQGQGFEPEIKKYEAEAERQHHRSDYFDLGELGVELALVLCSIAVLTRGRPFWYAGIVVGVLGAAVALTGFVVTRHAAQPEAHPATPARPAEHGLRHGAGLPGAAAPAGLDEAVDA